MICRQPIFGKNCFLSEEHWRESDHWRTELCYQQGVRLYFKCENYAHWNHFVKEDYFQRKALRKTFLMRHLPIKNGTSELMSKLDLYEPSSWNAEPDTDQHAPVTVHRSSAASAAASAVLEADDGSEMWDHVNDCFVPNTMGTEEAEDSFAVKLVNNKPKPKRKRKRKRKKKGKKKSLPKRKQVKKKK